MEREIKASQKIEEGLHKGVIMAVEDVTRSKGDKEFYYIDITLQFEEGKVIKAGYPDKVSPDTNLGKLLKRFGLDLDQVGAKIDISKILMNKACSFMTAIDGDFAKVMPDSLKPTK